MNKILIALYAACVLASTAYVFSRAGADNAPVSVAIVSGEPT